MSPNEAASPAGSPTLRTNIVSLVDKSGLITNVAPTSAWMVTQGQPANPPPRVTLQTGGPPYGWSIEFDAGRFQSNEVAGQFNNLCGANECVNTGLGATSPTGLNFYFGLDLTLESNGNTATVTVYMAQGSDGLDNNWWIGGDNISNQGVLTAWVGPDLVAISISGNSNGFVFGTPGSGPTLQSNIVEFYDASGTIVGMSPNGQWMVTFGQPMNTPPTVTPTPASPGTGFSIEIDAGRQDSSPVADQFNTLCGGQGKQWCIHSAFSLSPSELNFFFGVDLKLQSGANTAIVPIYLGQGSTEVYNNWWIGGECITSPNALSAQLTANVGGTTVTLLIGATANVSNQFLFGLQPNSEPSE